jgi:hypothetical protein
VAGTEGVGTRFTSNGGELSLSTTELSSLQLQLLGEVIIERGEHSHERIVAIISIQIRIGFFIRRSVRIVVRRDFSLVIDIFVGL